MDVSKVNTEAVKRLREFVRLFKEPDGLKPIQGKSINEIGDYLINIVTNMDQFRSMVRTYAVTEAMEKDFWENMAVTIEKMKPHLSAVTFGKKSQIEKINAKISEIEEILSRDLNIKIGDERYR